MPVIQTLDKRKFLSTYRGSGLIPLRATPYNPKNNRYIYLHKEGGFIDYSTLLNAGKTVGDIIASNKDLIKKGITTVGQVANSVNAISNAVKSSKDLEAIKVVKQNKKKKETENASKEIPMPKGVEEKMLAMGQGFSTFGGRT